MNHENRNKPEYGNWVPLKMIYVPAAVGLIFALLGFIHWGFFIGTAIFWLIAGYFALAWQQFSTEGGNIQEKIMDLILTHLDWQGHGQVLDIGCGNGPLTIKLAQKYKDAHLTGIDFWGKNWDYSQQLCEKNAFLAGVGERVLFQHASASKLPFEDGSFDLVVSNLVFHEVQDVKDKRIAVKEALRVLKPGGVFVLQDLFLISQYYGTPEELVKTVQDWGIRKVEFIRTCEEPFIPGLVKLPFMVGTIAIIRGVK
jgi:ubiquinone/menaquinone biosynthesis C-methylase UbiE